MHVWGCMSKVRGSNPPLLFLPVVRSVPSQPTYKHLLELKIEWSTYCWRLTLNSVPLKLMSGTLTERRPDEESQDPLERVSEEDVDPDLEYRPWAPDWKLAVRVPLAEPCLPAWMDGRATGHAG